MFEQAAFSAIFFFTILVFGKFVLKLYNEHIDRLDESNASLKKMADHLDEVVTEKRKRAEELAGRKIEAEKRKAYQQGKKEAFDSGKVTPIRSNTVSYRDFKDGEAARAVGEQVNRSLQPSEYNRDQYL